MSSLALATPGGLSTLDRESSIQELYGEAESLRRILQAHTAAELLLQTGNGANTEPVLDVLGAVVGWIRDVELALRSAQEFNPVARDLLPVVGMTRRIQTALVAAARRAPWCSVDAERRAIHAGLVEAVTSADAVLRGSSAEIRSFSAGCACESDRLAEMRRN